jgi:sporulation integral membrane protein YtvI
MIGKKSGRVSMISFYRKYWRTAFDIALIVLTVYLIMLAFSLIYRIAAPVLLSFVVFAIIEPLARFLHRRGIKKSIASALSILFFLMIIVGAIAGIGFIFVSQLMELQSQLPVYTEIVQREFAELSVYIQSRISALPEDWSERINGYVQFITNKGTDLAVLLLTKTFSLLTSFSTFIFNLVLAVVLAYFLSIEIPAWRKFAREKTPKTFKQAFAFLRDNVLFGIAGYLKSQAILIFITFLVIFVALLLLDVNNAFSIALLAGILDVLPLLGVSTLFIPWIIYLFLVGDTSLAIYLLILLAVVTLTRQVLEPKITGNTLGVSAFTMLSFMIVSLSLFGVAGLILSPVLIILLKALMDQGYLRRWIRLPKEEFEAAEP